MHVNAREMQSGRTMLNLCLSLGRRDVAIILAEYGAVKGVPGKIATAAGKPACCAVG